MTAKSKANAPPDKLALYERLVATNSSIEFKDMTNRYTFMNGHMFSRLDPSGKMALRLPAGERENFLKKYKTTLFHSYRIVQKEYVTIPDDLLSNTKELKKYFDLSVRYVQTLKPK